MVERENRMKAEQKLKRIQKQLDMLRSQTSHAAQEHALERQRSTTEWEKKVKHEMESHLKQTENEMKELKIKLNEKVFKKKKKKKRKRNEMKRKEKKDYLFIYLFI